MYAGQKPVQEAWLNGKKVWERTSGANAAALHEETTESHAGTMDDPIPYNNNMELMEGNYYVQGGVVYYCHQGSEQAVYADLSDLTIYVTPVTDE